MLASRARKIAQCNYLCKLKSNSRKMLTAVKGERVSNFKDQAKDKIDHAADVAKKTTEKVVDKAKELTHKTGESVEKGGKRLKDV